MFKELVHLVERSKTSKVSKVLRLTPRGGTRS
jgi:hypothetical protein